MLHLQSFLGIRFFLFECFCITRVERNTFFDINLIALCIFFHRLNIIPDFALEANIGHDAVSGFRVDAGHITRVRVTVRVAVGYVKEDYKLITVLDCLFINRFTHMFNSPFPNLSFSCNVPAFGDSIRG
ncbi:hypothetical protein SDC9_160499 [bioreactor metagenome]|uniref:Uncharacterized protein n=1 Tax=bioreactor metagenome TaxID=1076179 RepID=A0A645FIK2_9ZZZZ